MVRMVRSLADRTFQLWVRRLPAALHGRRSLFDRFGELFDRRAALRFRQRHHLPREDPGVEAAELVELA